VFHRQFEAAAVQNNWTSNEKAAHLSSVLQGKAADILHTVPAEAKYEDVVGALQDRFGDYQLATAYRSQLKASVQASSETLQEFTAAVGQLAYRAPCRASCCLYSNRSRPLFHRRCAGQGVEATPLNGRRPDPEWGLKSGLEIGGSQSGSREISKTPGVDRCAW